MKKQAKYLKIFEVFKKRIASGQYKRGQKLPTIKSVCSNFNVSLMTAKHGMDTLVKEGLVTAVNSSGFYVKGKGRSKTLKVAVFDFPKVFNLIETFCRSISRDMGIKIELIRYSASRGASVSDELKDANLILANEWFDDDFYKDCEPIDSIMNDFRYGYEDFYTELLSIYRVNGKQIGLPLLFSPMHLFYNKAIFDEKKIEYPDNSWNMADLESAADLLTGHSDLFNHHICGFQTPILGGNRWPSLVLQNEGRFFNSAGECQLGKDPNSVNALKRIKTLFSKYSLSLPMKEIERNFFRENRIAMSYLTFMLSGSKEDTLKSIFPGSKDIISIAGIIKNVKRNKREYDLGILITNETPIESQKIITWFIL